MLDYVFLLQLKWRLLGPNSVTDILEATNDVYHHSTGGQETTSGTLSWDASEGGGKVFILTLFYFLFIKLLGFVTTQKK